MPRDPADREWITWTLTAAHRASLLASDRRRVELEHRVAELELELAGYGVVTPADAGAETPTRPPD